MKTVLNGATYNVLDHSDPGQAILALEKDPCLVWKVKKIHRGGSKLPWLLWVRIDEGRTTD